jgi:CDP-glucose 4,6-dehydratase
MVLNNTGLTKDTRWESLEKEMEPSFWQDRPTLVTGGTGLLGGWLVRRLLELGADIVCLVRDWVPQCEVVHARLIDRVKAVRGDVCDQALMERILGEDEINTVFHLAAQTIVGTANRNPVSTFNTNIRGTWALLEACRRSPTVRSIIIASSDKAYGDQEKLPYDESSPMQGRYPYDVSKSCADLLAQSYASTYRLPVAITRCGNFYGGGDLNWNRVVPGTIRSIIRGQQPVIRSNGQYVRDYFYIEDGAAAYILLAEKLAQNTGIVGQAFNFSNETPISVLELVERISSLMETRLKPIIRGEVSNEIVKQYLNANKAHRLLGWYPIYTLEEGLRRTVSWYKDFFNVSKAVEIGLYDGNS